MLDFSDDALSVLASANFSYFVRAEVWQGDELLYTDLPIIRGSETVDRSLNINEEITLSVPRVVDNVDLSPYNDDSPLAANGQRLRVEVGVGLANGVIEWQQRGWFLIYESDVNQDTIDIRCMGMMQWILEARFVTPFQPTGNLTTAIRALVEPALTVVFDAGLVDRAVPAGISYTDERLDALNAVLDAWPAVAYVDNNGDLFVTTTTPSTVSVKTITEDTGTVITVSGVSSRDGVYNAVVARGSDASGNVIQGNVAYDYYTGHSVVGPFNPLPVPLYFDSPILTDANAATLAAQTRLANIIRQTTKSYQVTMVPDPSLEAGDTITLISRFGTVIGTIETLTLPYPKDNSAMTLNVRAL